MATVTVGRWWNGSFARMTRRDVWLKRDGERWWAEARKGNGDADVWRSPPGSERIAREVVAGLLQRGADQWRDLSELY